MNPTEFRLSHTTQFPFESSVILEGDGKGIKATGLILDATSEPYRFFVQTPDNVPTAESLAVIANASDVVLNVQGLRLPLTKQSDGEAIHSGSTQLLLIVNGGEAQKNLVRFLRSPANRPDISGPRSFFVKDYTVEGGRTVFQVKREFAESLLSHLTGKKISVALAADPLGDSDLRTLYVLATKSEIDLACADLDGPQ